MDIIDLDAHPVYFKGCKVVKDIIAKKSIKSKYYAFAQLRDSEWIAKSGASCRYDRLIVRANYAKAKIIKDEHKVNQTKYDILPPKILLYDGNALNINIVGDRYHDKCYFSVMDMSHELSMVNLRKTILDKRGTYEYSKHYVKFYKDGRVANESGNVEIYLTYRGFIKVLYTSPEVFKVSFNKLARTVPCVYLIHLGKVSDLRSIFSIPADVPNDNIIFKYGKTNDLSRRLGEHKLRYTKLGVTKDNIYLDKYAMIDAQFITKAEIELKEFFAFNNYKLRSPGYEFIVNKYKSIMSKYVGRYITEINTLKLEYESKLGEHKDKIIMLSDKLMKKDEYIISLLTNN